MTASLPKARTSDEKTREIAGVAGTALFAAAAILEFVRLQSNGAPWPGFTTETDWIFSLLAIVLWIGSAFVLAGRRRDHIILAIAGTFALFSFGIIGTIAGSKMGIVYVVFAMAMPVVMRLAFGGKIDLGKRVPEPERPHGPREVI
jgi:hypothetical protein